MTQHTDLIPLIVDRANATLPTGCDRWGIKSTRPDLTTRGRYQWPYPGGVAQCDPSRIVQSNRDTLPSQAGDGLCAALTWAGMAPGGFPARTMLLVAWATADELSAADPDKVRVSRAQVVALVYGEQLLRDAGAYANLTYADLTGANLTGANLTGANLTGADLAGADLTGANLTGADLTCADLTYANLTYADLAGADLTYADLALPADWTLSQYGIAMRAEEDQ